VLGTVERFEDDLGFMGVIARVRGPSETPARKRRISTLALCHEEDGLPGMTEDEIDVSVAPLDCDWELCRDEDPCGAATRHEFFAGPKHCVMEAVPRCLQGLLQLSGDGLVSVVKVQNGSPVSSAF
jgi:hypothetical protein